MNKQLRADLYPVVHSQSSIITRSPLEQVKTPWRSPLLGRSDCSINLHRELDQ